MSRTPLTDDSGSWFDSRKSTKFGEGSRWDGSNHISLATGSQWDHQALWRTRSGRWILQDWSQRQGSAETFEEITDKDAAKWLIKNERVDELADNDPVKKTIDRIVSEMEL